MFCTNCLLLLLITNIITFTGDQVDELSAAAQDQLPGVIGHPDVGQQLLDHLVHGRPRDGQFVIIVPISVSLGTQFFHCKLFWNIL